MPRTGRWCCDLGHKYSTPRLPGIEKNLTPVSFPSFDGQPVTVKLGPCLAHLRSHFRPIPRTQTAALTALGDGVGPHRANVQARVRWGASPPNLASVAVWPNELLCVLVLPRASGVLCTPFHLRGGQGHRQGLCVKAEAAIACADAPAHGPERWVSGGAPPSCVE